VNEELRAHRLRALFCAGVLLLNFPLLALWDRDALLFGVPLFPAALFIVWAALIVALACIIESAPIGAAGTSPAAGEPPLRPSAPP
jgi:hypothetical protein